MFVLSVRHSRVYSARTLFVALFADQRRPICLELPSGVTLLINPNGLLLALLGIASWPSQAGLPGTEVIIIDLHVAIVAALRSENM